MTGKARPSSARERCSRQPALPRRVLRTSPSGRRRQLPAVPLPKPRPMRASARRRPPARPAAAQEIRSSGSCHCNPGPPVDHESGRGPVPRALGGVPIDPDATIVSDPDDTGVVDRNLTTYVRRPEDETRAGGPDESPTGFDRTRLGMPEGIVVKPTDGPSGPLAPGTPFGPRYHIVRLLGIGGMGAVYQAWDAELGVAVALKVIRPEVAADPDGRARFWSGDSSRSCCSPARSRTRTSSASTTSARSTASSSSRCRSSRARISPRSSTRSGKLPIARVLRIARQSRRPRGRARRGRRPPRPEAGQHHGRRGTAAR